MKHKMFCNAEDMSIPERSPIVDINKPEIKLTAIRRTIKDSNKMPNLLPNEPLIKGATLLILLVFNILKIGNYLIHTDYHKEERIHTHKIRQ